MISLLITTKRLIEAVTLKFQSHLSQFVLRCRDSVILGEYDVTKDPDCDGDFCSSKQDVKVEQVIAHPQYQQAGNVNDIALVRLAQNVQYSGK